MESFSKPPSLHFKVPALPEVVGKYFKSNFDLIDNLKFNFIRFFYFWLKNLIDLISEKHNKSL